MATSQDFVNWVCGPQLEPDYLKYVLLAERDSLLRFASGTTHQTIYYPEAKAFCALLPSPPEQRQILSVLGPIDDKLEANRQACKTLAATADTLFKSWFIAFDPVREKAAGRRPAHMDASTASEFSSALMESPVGLVPVDWRVCRLGDVLQLKRGYDLPTTLRSPGQVPIISSSGPTAFHNEARATGPGIVTGRYGTIGRVFLVWEDYWPLNTSLYVRALHDANFFYAYFLLQQIDFEKFSDKAAVPGVNRNHVETESVCVAPRVLQEAFARRVEPLLRLIRHRERESETLRELRDLLLPKLLSGELRARDAHRVAEAAAS